MPKKFQLFFKSSIINNFNHTTIHFSHFHHSIEHNHLTGQSIGLHPELFIFYQCCTPATSSYNKVASIYFMLSLVIPARVQSCKIITKLFCAIKIQVQKFFTDIPLALQFIWVLSSIHFYSSVGLCHLTFS